MGLRFRRTWSVFPGVRLNLGLKSGSVSFGVRGLHYTVGTRGQRVTAGIPGTGLFWTKKINPSLTPGLPRTSAPVPTIGGGQSPPQLGQTQVHLSPQPAQHGPAQYNTQVRGAFSRLSQFITTHIPTPTVKNRNQPPSTLQTHVFLPSWLVWAVPSVIVIAGLCMVAAVIGNLSR